MQRTKCAYCILYRVGNQFESICGRPDGENENEPCIEVAEDKPCDEKMEA